MKKSIEKLIECECCGEIRDAEMICQKEFIKEEGKEAFKKLKEEGDYFGAEYDYSYRRFI